MTVPNDFLLLEHLPTVVPRPRFGTRFVLPVLDNVVRLLDRGLVH